MKLLILLRQLLITRWLYARFKKVTPRMSETEKAAIAAGDVSWEAQLFQGRPNWQQLLALPTSKLTREEQQFMGNQVEVLCSKINDWQVTNEAMDLSPAAWDYLKKEKFFGMIIPKKYGGLGFSALAHSEVIQKISTRSLTAAVTTMVPNSLGPGELLLMYGTTTQKDHYLPRLATGEEIPCFALTSLEAGSDAGSIIDSGYVCYENYNGKKTLGMKISWCKRYITLAPVATVLGLAFKLYDPEHILGNQEEIGITLCLLPTEHPGVKTGNRHYPLNQAFMNGPTEGHDVFVPMDWIIGGQEMVGCGWQMLMECLAAGRGISLPALSTGIAKLCYVTTGAYASIRKQFKVPIGKFGGVAASMAQIAGFTYTMEAARILTTSIIDSGKKPSVISAIVKYHMTEMARSVINHAMDIHGGRGIMLGPNNYLARAYQGIPISITVEGANILTRNLIIFGQGAIRCHPYVFAEITATNVAEFDRNIFAHIGYTIANFTKMVFHGVTANKFIPALDNVNPQLQKYYQQLSYMSLVLATIADVAMMVLGGKLKRMEQLSARLGDILSHLYLGAAILKYYHENANEAELPIAIWSLQTCLYNCQQALRGFLDNFPNRIIAKLLACKIFPLGYQHHMPRDLQAERIADMMMKQQSLRQRFLQDCYVGDATQPVAILEHAFNSMLEDADDLSDALFAALKVDDFNYE